ncbi:MAG: hypothetical protein ACR2PL_07315 [Dehalococcoidia bacterium]
MDLTFIIDDVFRLHGRGGPIAVGRLQDGGVVRCGDHFHFSASNNRACVVEVIGVEMTPAAVSGKLALVLAGTGVADVQPGVVMSLQPSGTPQAGSSSHL